MNKKRDNKRLYIAYGSNINIRQMQYRCPDAAIVGTSVIPNCELLFRGSKTGAYATIQPHESKSVPVLIWETSARDEIALDQYEGYPRFYGKEEVEIQFNGKPLTTYVYKMPESYELGMPSNAYINTILEGYQAVGFDREILGQAIETTINLMEQQNISATEYEEFDGQLSMDWGE